MAKKDGEKFYEQAGDGEEKRCREVVGGNWGVSFGSKLDIYGLEDRVVIMTTGPFVTVDYDRKTHALTKVSVSVLDMVFLADGKTLLEVGDKSNVADRYEMRMGIALTLDLSSGVPSVFVTNFSGAEFETKQQTNEELTDLLKLGIVGEGKDLTFADDFGFLTGKVGLTLTNSEVVFFYEKKKGEGVVRIELLRVAREPDSVGVFDEIALEQMPSKTEALHLLEGVFLEPKNG